jgi:type IV secretion system protein VirB1
MKRLLLTTIFCLFPIQAISSTTQSYIERCLPSSHWGVMQKIVSVESGGELYAIGINKKGYRSKFPTTLREAKREAQKLLDKGLNIDIGLSQINSQHFKPGRIFAKKGFVATDALNPCTNLKMGAMILSGNYRRYKSLPEALSAYNTGNPRDGFSNGYVERYTSK